MELRKADKSKVFTAKTEKARFQITKLEERIAPTRPLGPFVPGHCAYGACKGGGGGVG